jgi:hypothetical protein
MRHKTEIKIKRILNYLFILAILSFAVLTLLYFYSGIGKDIMLSGLGLAFMFFSSVLFVIAIRNSLKSTNKMAFIQVTMANVFLKIIGILVIVVVYYKIFKPDSKIIILPFLLIYAIFTIFETVFTYKIAKENS